MTLEQLRDRWREEADRHERLGDCYRVGKGWGLKDCANDLDAYLAREQARVVSRTDELPKLDAILYDRPAGRAIIDHAIDTIERLRTERNEAQARFQQAATALRETAAALATRAPKTCATCRHLCRNDLGTALGAAPRFEHVTLSQTCQKFGGYMPLLPDFGCTLHESITEAQ